MMNRIVKEGYLNKRSKFVGVSRQRWTVLSHQYLKTYKAKRVYDNPTEVFDLMLYDTTEHHENGFSLVSTTDNVMKRVFTVGNLDDLRDWVAKIRDTQCRLKIEQSGVDAIMQIKSQINNQQTVEDTDDEYGVMCVCGFIRMHMACNNVIPEELKQLIMHFVGEYYFFMKTINDSEHEQIELKIHSHKGHYDQYTPEKMLQPNSDWYIATCSTND
eukprot:123053_1